MGQIMAIRRRARAEAAAQARAVLPDWDRAQEILDQCRARYGSDIGIDEAQAAVDAARLGSSKSPAPDAEAVSEMESDTEEVVAEPDLRSQWDLKSSPEVYYEKYAEADPDALSDSVRERFRLADQIVNG